MYDMHTYYRRPTQSTAGIGESVTHTHQGSCCTQNSSFMFLSKKCYNVVEDETHKNSDFKDMFDFTDQSVTKSCVYDNSCNNTCDGSRVEQNPSKCTMSGYSFRPPKFIFANPCSQKFFKKEHAGKDGRALSWQNI